ncbi:hypothetical protein BAC3_01694 [uncultured bacterium]|nr:hypothetical protein BAC3_01694 [uncultured bacterium]
MKKIIFALLLLAAGVLFVINYLANITGIETDKVKTSALNQLTATDNKPEPAKNPPKTENKEQSIIEQVTNTVTPIINQATETVKTPLENNAEKSKQSNTKSPKATIKFYDKKTAKETIIDSTGLLESEQQKLSSDDQQKLQEKAAKFRNYYKKSEKCLSPASQEIRVQCANEYMRAKAKFEELYQQGKL